MVQTRAFVHIAAFVLFSLVPLAFAYGPDLPEGKSPAGRSTASPTATPAVMSSASMDMFLHPELTYFAHPEHGGIMLAHIVLMTVAWFFVLPIGK